MMVQTSNGEGGDTIVQLEQLTDENGEFQGDFEGDVQIRYAGDVVVYAQVSDEEYPIKVFKFIAVSY